MSEKAVKGYECRHAIYCPSNQDKDDMLAIKEYIHYEDGTSEPNFRMIENYKREFWVTKEGFQTHKDKKEWEQEERLRRFTCTQSVLKERIGKALGKPGAFGSLRMLARSPYLYGCDVTTPVLMKHSYQRKYPDCVTLHAKVAALDIETDVVNGTERIIAIGVSCKDQAFLAATNEFLNDTPNPEKRLHKAIDEHLPEIKKERDLKVDFRQEESPGQMCAAAIQWLHEQQPDFVSIWNMNYDLPEIVQALHAASIDPGEVFSDPRVPEKYRYYHYKEGPSQKVTSKGDVLPLHPADRWHTALFPATWYVLDSMCVYKKIRTVKGNEPDYTLEGVLNRNLDLGKLKFEQADGFHGLNWHRKMQTDHKIEYLVYNLWDCIGLEVLDEKTGDISRAFDTLAGVSEYSNFNSNPRRINDDLHFFCRDRGLVIGTTSDQMEDELDKYVVSRDDWIVTLPSYLVDENGMSVIDEAPNIRSMARAHVADLDIEGTYPNIEDILNISKETTMTELHDIVGVPDAVRRSIGINLTGGPVNANEIGQRAFNLPSSEQLLATFQQELSQEESS